jgi:hypothetical protein
LNLGTKSPSCSRRTRYCRHFRLAGWDTPLLALKPFKGDEIHREKSH